MLETRQRVEQLEKIKIALKSNPLLRLIEFIDESIEENKFNQTPISHDIREFERMTQNLSFKSVAEAVQLVNNVI